jgi:hypothetical protein
MFAVERDCESEDPKWPKQLQISKIRSLSCTSLVRYFDATQNDKSNGTKQGRYLFFA